MYRSGATTAYPLAPAGFLSSRTAVIVPFSCYVRVTKTNSGAAVAVVALYPPLVVLSQSTTSLQRKPTFRIIPNNIRRTHENARLLSHTVVVV